MAAGEIQHIGWAYERPDGKAAASEPRVDTITKLGEATIGDSYLECDRLDIRSRDSQEWGSIQSGCDQVRSPLHRPIMFTRTDSSP